MKLGKKIKKWFMGIPGAILLIAIGLCCCAAVTSALHSGNAVLKLILMGVPVVLPVVLIVLRAILYNKLLYSDISDPYETYKKQLSNTIDKQLTSSINMAGANLSSATIIINDTEESEGSTESEKLQANRKKIEKTLYDIHLGNIVKGDKYFDISLTHAKASFVFSIIACSMGMILLVVAVVLAAKKGSLEAGIVPTIGAGIAEFIAATVFWVHRKSAEQLNRYYDSLHEIDVMESAADMINSSESPEECNQLRAILLQELYAVQKIKAAKPEKYDKPAGSKSKENPERSTSP